MTKNGSEAATDASLGQAPKLSKKDKEGLILSHLRASGTCYTIKELEKMLPGVASINSIQVKDYVQGLVDEGSLRVEKIGNGNWYWSFGLDDKREREQQLARVQMEVEKARKSHADSAGLVALETARREDEAIRAGPDLDRQRQSLQDRKLGLEQELRCLRDQLAASGESVKSKGAQQLRQELAGFKEQALQWTDNLHILEQHLREMVGGDRELVAAVLQDCYGAEYVDGGLGDLE